MTRVITLGFLVTVLAAAAHTRAENVSFDFASIGNAGNAADPETGFGAVSYAYAIATTEVTNAQYVVFLNAVDPTGDNDLRLFNYKMAGSFGGIEDTGVTDGARYIAQAGREQNPVTYVSFLDAMRFVNWLHNGQGSGDTETGAYTIGNGLDEVRSPDARYWIPSEDEWYKAAYHDASAGAAGAYFDYATGSDSLPVSDRPSDNPSAVNYWNDDGLANGFNEGYAVVGSPILPSGYNPLTNVGAYTEAASPYGTFDQNGSVLEWNETVRKDKVTPLYLRGLRGGAYGTWSASASLLQADRWASASPQWEDDAIGLRVATLPEPSAMAVAGSLAIGALLFRR